MKTITRKSKLEEHGLLDEAKRLKDTGMSDNEVATHLMHAHPEVSVSLMAVRRGLDILEKKKLDEQIQEGLNPADEFTKEYRKEMQKIFDRSEKILSECEKTLADAKSSGIMSDRLKALDVSIKGLANERKNRESLQQFGFMKIDTINKKAFEQKEQVNNLLMIWINKLESGLCPRCKQEVIPEVIKLIQLEKEEK